MIRIMVALWSVLAVGVGVGLFLLKHEVQSLEDDLNRINRDIQARQESIHVLKAEWSFLNDPARLRRLAETHLHMTAPLPDQVTGAATMAAALTAMEQRPALLAAVRGAKAGTRAMPAQARDKHQPTITATPAKVTPLPSRPVALAPAKPRGLQMASVRAVAQ